MWAALLRGGGSPGLAPWSASALSSVPPGSASSAPACSAAEPAAGGVLRRLLRRGLHPIRDDDRADGDWLLEDEALDADIARSPPGEAGEVDQVEEVDALDASEVAP